MDDIKKSSIHVFAFDERMNSVTQSCKTDVYIRYWHSLDMEVKVPYLGSSFFGHGKHQNLFKNFHKITAGLDETKLFQISTDGPNVNF